ncbi:MAG TPA: hypothetical protein VG348_05955, partial [Acidimicrobiia bacterium]|nr:hypothetical protein [Acidimicrobiia bacterium]
VFRTISGMVAVITAVLAGSEVGLAVIAAFDAPAASFVAGGVAALGALVAMVKYEHDVWARAAEEPITVDDVPTS